MMKINRSVLIALGLILVITLWFVFQGLNGQEQPSDVQDPQDTPTTTDTSLPTVQVAWVKAEPHDKTFRLYGRSEPDREVSVKAETAGLIVSIPVTEGRYVKKGSILCQQDIDARQAVLDQSKALLQTRKLEYEAALKLVEKGYRSETSVAGALAALDGAKASVKQAEIELDNVNIRAPFSGVFEKKQAEIGDFLTPGQPCGLLVDLNPIIISTELTEQQVGFIAVGNTAQISLVTGEQLTGKIRQIETRANPATRTFRAEITLPNPKFTLKAGVTATVSLTAGEVPAHHIPAHVIALNDNGQIGIRYVDEADIVRFRAVNTIDEDIDGVWVTGLPENVRIIIQGQDYVSAGTQVEPQYPSTQSATSQ